MLYPVYVHMGNDTTAHGVTFPDFEGCFAAADDWADLPTAIQEAVEAHFFGESSPIPAPTPLEELTDNPEYQGGVWLLADVDLSRINSKPIRLNISLPANLVHQIDAYAQTHQMTRSGFLAQDARHAISTNQRQ